MSRVLSVSISDGSRRGILDSFRSLAHWLTGSSGSLAHLAHEIIKLNSIHAADEYVAVTKARRSNL